MAEQSDAIVVGAGHNGLVAAAVLARAGLSVRVLEARDEVGGACVTEHPFPKAPGVGASSGAYLLGLMPPELLAELEIELPLLRRDPHYFLPTLSGRYLLLGGDAAKNREAFARFFSEEDARADERLQAELAALREDVGPTWLMEPASIEETAERFVRPALREAFVRLCRGSVGAYLDRFGFKSDLIKAMYAATDGYSGIFGTWDTPGSGMNFLIHNMCRLPGAGGTWMLVRGGMGTVTQALADAARRAGAVIETGAKVARIERVGDAVEGVLLEDGRRIRAEVILSGADPFRMRALLGRGALPEDYNARLDGCLRDGSTLKVNLCLEGLPTFTCLPEDRGQFRTTTHILPEEDPIGASVAALEAVRRGELPAQPTIEWYFHTVVDPSLSREPGRHNAALFVQWVPYALKGGWEAQEEGYVRHLLSILDRYAPDTSSRVVDLQILHPQKIESRFGITRGHIHHIDNTYGFADRLPYRTPIEGLYAASAGCHPGGSVIGAAGYVAAQVALDDLRCETTLHD